MTTKLTFTLTAGCLIRRQVQRQIREYAWSHDYDLLIDEDRGWVNSLFMVRMDVPEAEAERVRHDIKRWVASNA